MATVRFLRDFRGVATAEQFYTAGSVVDLSDHLVKMLLAEKVVTVQGVAGAPVVVPAPPAPRRPGRPRKAAA